MKRALAALVLAACSAPAPLPDLVSAERLGRKSGAGFYDYARK